MKNRHRRVIGWMCADAMNPTEAAEACIAKVALFGKLQGAVIHLDQVTGRLTLTDRDAAVGPSTFVRGVAWNSDPDVLADDLRTEAKAAKLFAGRPSKGERWMPRPARRVA